MAWPNKILMVSPNGYRVEYAINPFMQEADGTLKRVDSELAWDQWKRLRDLYAELGLDVEVLDGDPAFPDMVFCANQCFPFIGDNGEQCVALSRMRSPQRQGEVDHFRRWAREHGYRIVEMTDHYFEGCGDAIWNFETGEIFGGFGYRTEAGAYEKLKAITHAKIHRLKLIDPNFYHLDTCFSILRGDTAAFVPEAFEEDGVRVLNQNFRNLIRIQKEEALLSFAGNCFSPNGRDVLLNPGASELKRALDQLGFTVHEIDTSEFIKAGGSVFCMKQTL